MSGAAFLAQLQRLGCPGISDYDGDSFEWLFELNPQVVPFMEWFCDNVHESNVVSEEELKEFAELEETSGGVLRGAQLEELLQNLSLSEEVDFSLEKLQSEVHQLEAEVAASHHRKHTLTQLRNKLSIHQLSLNERYSKLDRVAAEAKKEYKTHQEHVYEDNNKMNACIQDVSSSVSDLMCLYADLGSPGSAEQTEAVFLSQVDLRGYHNQEDRFGAQLAAYTRKQFFEGIADIASDGDPTMYEFLEISKPVNLLVRGERQEVNLDECKELARLQKTYPQSTCNAVNALVELHSTQAACQFAEDKAKQLKSHPYPTSISELGARLQEAESRRSLIARDLDSMGMEEVPALIKESAKLQVTKILKGNYDLKIARQDYFTSNQDALIAQLLLQQGRNDLLTMAYELELRSHKDTHQLLTAASMQLSRTRSSYDARQTMMQNNAQAAGKHERGTVDSRDRFITRLHSCLAPAAGEQEKQQLFLTYAQLQEQASRMRQQLHTLRQAVRSTSCTQDEKLALLETNLAACESCVYRDSPTSGGAPLLSPPVIHDTLTQCLELVEKAQTAANGIISDIEAKKKNLKIDPLQKTERNLFVYFMKDHARLRRALAEVQSRMQAMRPK